MFTEVQCSYEFEKVQNEIQKLFRLLIKYTTISNFNDQEPQDLLNNILH